MTDKFKAEQFDAICSGIDGMTRGMGVAFTIHECEDSPNLMARLEWYVGGNRNVVEIVQPTAKMLLLDVARRLP